jgi:hypothetical protein
MSDGVVLGVAFSGIRLHIKWRFKIGKGLRKDIMVSVILKKIDCLCPN